MAALQFAHQFEHVEAMSLPQQNAVAGPSGLAQSALVQVTIPEAPNGRPSSGSGRPLSRSGLLTPPLSAGPNSFSQSRFAMQRDASNLRRPNNVSPSVAGPSHHRNHHSHVPHPPSNGPSQQQVVQNNRVPQGYISELSQQPNLLHTIQQQQHYGGMARRTSQAQMDDQRNRPAMHGPLPSAQMQMTSNNSSTNNSTGFPHLQFQYPQFSSGHTNPAPVSAQQQMQAQGTSSGPAPQHAQHPHASRSNAMTHAGANAPAASPTNPQPGVDVFGPAPPNIFDPATWDPNGMAAVAFVSSRKFLEASQQTLATELTRLKEHYRTREACAAQTFTNRISDLYRCLANAKSERDAAVQAQQEAEESCKRAQEAEAKTKEHCTSLYTASLRIDKECMLVKKERDELKNENWELKEVIARMAIEENVRIKKDPSVSEEEKKAVAERVAEREAVIASAFAQAKENETKLREEVEKRTQLERELEVLKHIVKQQLYQTSSGSQMAVSLLVHQYQNSHLLKSLSSTSIPEMATDATFTESTVTELAGMSTEPIQCSPSGPRSRSSTVGNETLVGISVGLATPKSQLGTMDWETQESPAAEQDVIDLTDTDDEPAPAPAPAPPAGEAMDVDGTGPRKRSRSPDMLDEAEPIKKARTSEISPDSSASPEDANPLTFIPNGLLPADGGRTEELPPATVIPKSSTDATQEQEVKVEDLELQYEEDELEEGEAATSAAPAAVVQPSAKKVPAEVREVKDEVKDGEIQEAADTVSVPPAPLAKTEVSMKAERAEGAIAAPGTPQASIKQSPSSPASASPRKQLSISHLSLAYHTIGKRLVCRICRERKMRIDQTLSVTMFPDDAPWSDLSGHCEHEHPQSFEKLINMNPKELTELRLKYGVLR